MKRTIAMLLCVLLILFTGCAPQQVDATPKSGESGQRIHLIVTPADEDAPSQANTFFKSEELNNNYAGTLVYSFLVQVDILLGNDSFPLDQAIREGHISVEELTAMAFADAKNGLCTHSAQSTNGLNSFIFRYPSQFDLRIICDIYETPDGNQHLMNEICVYPYLSAEHAQGPYTEFDEDGSFRYIDVEDWGLTFDCQSVSSTGMILKITQANGQHAGQLSIDYYMIYNRDISTDLTTPDGHMGATTGIFPASDITNNGQTELTFDWSETFGILESGNYSLILMIKDIYCKADVHPLQRNYHDTQVYSIEFEIP